MKPLYSYFSLSILIALLIIASIPFGVSASDTIFYQDDYDDSNNGVFSDSAYFSFVEGYSGLALKEARTTTGQAYEYAIINGLHSQPFECSFRFMISGMNTNDYNVISFMGSLATGTNGLLVKTVSGVPHAFIGGTDTNIALTNNTWHSFYCNVTGNFIDWKIDNNPMGDDYSISVPANVYVILGQYSASSTGAPTCYWDNMILGTRVGEAPSASFTVSPETGDGLTNFVFDDSSTLSSTPIDHTWYWDFGDGNWTITDNANNVNHTYIHEGNYTITLTVTNAIGNSLAYNNITVTAIVIGIGGEEISDEMFGFIIVILLITGLNILGTKTGYLMLSIFAMLGMIIAIPALWQNDPLYITLMLVSALGNIALLVYGLTRD